jgi:hypothetical protein
MLDVSYISKDPPGSGLGWVSMIRFLTLVYRLDSLIVSPTRWAQQQQPQRNIGLAKVRVMMDKTYYDCHRAFEGSERVGSKAVPLHYGGGPTVSNRSQLRWMGWADIVNVYVQPQAITNRSGLRRTGPVV